MKLLKHRKHDNCWFFGEDFIEDGRVASQPIEPMEGLGNSDSHISFNPIQYPLKTLTGGQGLRAKENSAVSR